MEQSSLIRLIEASRNNDATAFRRLVEAHQAMIFRLAFRLLGNEESAKDVVQETFIRVWTHLSDFDTARTFSTWICTITTRLCQDVLKSSGYKQSGLADEALMNRVMSSDNIEQRYINAELAAIVALLTEHLTPLQKLVFTLRDLETLEVDEVCQITGLTPPQIKSNLFLARKAIRQQLSRL